MTSEPAVPKKETVMLHYIVESCIPLNLRYDPYFWPSIPLLDRVSLCGKTDDNSSDWVCVSFDEIENYFLKEDATICTECFASAEMQCRLLKVIPI